MGLTALLLGLLLNCATVLMHVTAVALALPKIRLNSDAPLGRRRALDTAPVMTLAVSGLLALQLLSAFAWALTFWLTGLEPTFDQAVFLALTTISALGGDEHGIASSWRVLLPLASINGALLFGLSTAVMFRLVTVFHFSEAQRRSNGA